MFRPNLTNIIQTVPHWDQDRCHTGNAPSRSQVPKTDGRQKQGSGGSVPGLASDEDISDAHVLSDPSALLI